MAYWTKVIRTDEKKTLAMMIGHDTIAQAKKSYLKSWGDKKDEVKEVVLLKGSGTGRNPMKIHSYRDNNFKIDRSIPVDIHNIIYGYE
tara:strand:- start:81 stop:344 length:264 start_codon:yes stop_codon:yes gene_type:complete